MVIMPIAAVFSLFGAFLVGRVGKGSQSTNQTRLKRLKTPCLLMINGTDMGKKYSYSDFDLSFRPNPITGDLIMKYDVQAILQSCRNLLLTSTEEMVMNMEIGGGISRLLFELNTPTFKQQLREKILSVIEKYEPRIEIVELTVSDITNNQYGVIVRLTFYVLNQADPITVDLPLRRTR